MRVSGFGLRTPNFESGVLSSEFQVSCFGFRVSGFEFWVSESGFRFKDPGFHFRVPGSWFRVSGFGVSGWENLVQVAALEQRLENQRSVSLTLHLYQGFWLRVERLGFSGTKFKHM